MKPYMRAHRSMFLLGLWILAWACGVVAAQSDRAGGEERQEEGARCLTWLGVQTVARFQMEAGPEPVAAIVPKAMIPFDAGSEEQPRPILLVLDAENHALYELIPANGSPAGDQMEARRLAGAPGVAGFQDGSREAALFNYPAGMTFDRQGRLYVADSGNGVVRRVGRTGEVETVAYGPDEYTPFERPVGVAYGRIDGRDKLAVADQNAVYILDLEDTAVPTITLSFDQPTHLDWWKDTDISPEEADWTWGRLIVAHNQGIHWARMREDGSFRVFPVADTKVNSLFIEEQGHLYITTPENTGIARIERSPVGYASPRPLLACGESLQSPQVAATYFGHLLVVDAEGDGLRLKQTRLEDSPAIGVHDRCVRCGPPNGGPAQVR